MKAKITSIILLFFLALGASAQTASLTTQTESFSAAGGDVTFDVTFTYTGLTLSTSGFEIDLPTGWSYDPSKNSNVPTISPEGVTTGKAEFAIFGLPPANSYNFTVVLTYDSGLTSAQNITGQVLYTVQGQTATTASFPDVTIDPPPTAPTITSQPQSLEVNEGSFASFSSGASGSPAPTFQWQKDGVDIPGATSQSLPLDNVSASDAGVYTLIATNSQGSVTSDPATLTVVTGPSIDSQPMSQTVNEGGNVTFTVGASGANLTYQWRLNGVDFTGQNTTASFSGQNTASLQLNGVSASDAGSYDVVVTNPVSSVVSSPATLTVLIPPSIGTQPMGTTVNAGDSYTFTAVANGSAPFSYQWKKDGVDISGATDNQLTLDPIAAGDAGIYTVDITNAAGNVTSSDAELVVNFAPIINTQPTDQVSGVGGTVNFEVVATAFPEITGYQWFRFTGQNTPVNFAGQNTSTLQLTGVSLQDAGNFYVEITNPVGTTTSDTVTLTVNDSPAIVSHPMDTTLNEGDQLQLMVSLTGSPTPTLQWQFAASGSDSYSDLAGQTSDTLTLPNLQRSQAGNYRVVATNTFGTVNSDAAAVTVNYAPEITQDLEDLAVGVGGTATFNIEGVASPEPTFQWFLLPAGSDSASAIDGATEGEYTTPVASLSNNGDRYYVVIDNGIGDPVQSRTATLTVNEQGQVTSQPSDQTVDEGQPASFMIEFSGNPTPTIQWNLNGSPIAGANSATYSIAMTNRSQAGEYTATVTNQFGSDTSDPATLQVDFAPEITQDLPAQTFANVGDTVTLNVEGEASPEPTFQWFRSTPVSSPPDGGETPAITSPGDSLGNFAPIDGATDGELVLENVTREDSGSMFYLVATNSKGSIQSATTTFTIYDPPVINRQPLGGPLNQGAPYDLVIEVGGDPAPSIQWFKDGSPISGATGNTLRIASASTADAGTYFARATNGGGTVDSDPAVIVVNTRPVITSQPAGGSRLVGESFSATVVATGAGPLTYQWSFNGTDISGATDATLTLPSVTLADEGEYRVVVTNSLGSATSTVAPLTITRVLRAPTISVQPRNTSIREGGSATLSVVATGTPMPTYQWTRNGAPLAGQTGSSLALADVTEASAGLYRVIVSNSQGNVASSIARVRVTTADVAPVITGQPRNKTAGLDEEVTFRVGATGVPEPSYQWRKNGVDITGATSPIYSFTTTAVGDAGLYSVVVTNSAGSATSRNAQLTVYENLYTGSYFGSFGEGRGSFVITIGDDNTGTFLGFDEIAGLYVIGTVVVDQNGSFSFTVLSRTPIAPPPTNRVVAGATPSPSVAGNEVTISGTIGEGGEVSGSVEGVEGLSVSGDKDEGTEAEDVAGFYQAGASGSDSVTYTVITPSGQVIVFTETPEGADAGVGTISSEGEVEVTTVANQTVSATVVANTSTIQAEVTDSTGETISFSGGNEEVIASQRLVNISSRASAGTGESQTIAGLVITGEDSKPVLIRAVGPGLAEFGVTGVLAAPQLDLYSGQEVIATNTGWSNSADATDIAEAASLAGAFALDSANADSAILETLPPGSYTAQVRGADGGTGVVLVEVYDLSAPEIGQKLFNISTRAATGSGNQTVVAGFVVSGSVPKRVMLRGVGPTLGDFGVNGALADPRITLFRGADIVASNDDWNNSAAVTEASTATGAFQLGADSKDAALVISLDPGVYTLHMSGVGGSSGVGLIEVYEVP